jgi:peptide deformylase
MIITDKNVLEGISKDTTIEECVSLDLFSELDNALEDSDIPGCGLAAIQIGYALRACIAIIGEKTYRMINPRLVRQAEPIVWPGEACLSQPGRSYTTDRYNQVTIGWIDYMTGTNKLKDFEGFSAVVLQHEIDHMDGILNYKREHKNMPKIGRNEMCPCGSGKKHKKCCINRKQEAI